jgi:hypothetical protein
MRDPDEMWTEATVLEWPRAKAIRSWLASSTLPRRWRKCATARFRRDHRRPRERLISYQQLGAGHEISSQKKAAAPFGTAAF